MNAINKMNRIGLAAAILVSGFVASANAAAPELHVPVPWPWCLRRDVFV